MASNDEQIVLTREERELLADLAGEMLVGRTSDNATMIDSLVNRGLLKRYPPWPEYHWIISDKGFQALVESIATERFAATAHVFNTMSLGSPEIDLAAMRGNLAALARKALEQEERIVALELRSRNRPRAAVVSALSHGERTRCESIRGR